MSPPRARTARSSPTPFLSVGVLPLPNFTHLAFAAFVDTLRLAADEGDQSRQIRCAWTVLGDVRRPIRASNGVMIQAQDGLIDPARFDYLVVVGGTLYGGPQETPTQLEYLRKAEALGVPLIGLCTGSFTLARAGLMAGRRACVSWFHHHDYAAEFPKFEVISDRIFLDDGDRITCAGGVSVVHLASWLVERHCGEGSAAKGLRIMIEDSPRGGDAPQPSPLLGTLTSRSDPRVRRATLMLERSLSRRVTLAKLARGIGVSTRHLNRLFLAEFGCTPIALLETLRLARARELLQNSSHRLADIASECGFADAAHLCRRFKRVFGLSPGKLRGAALNPSDVERTTRSVRGGKTGMSLA